MTPTHLLSVFLIFILTAFRYNLRKMCFLCFLTKHCYNKPGFYIKVNFVII